MNRYACAILLRDGRILLGKRAAHRRAYPDCWDVIGGKVEISETLEGALARELDEELGITPLDFSFLLQILDSNPRGRGTAIYAIFVVRSWLGEPEMRNNEHSELGWFALEAACSLPNLALAEYPVLFRQLLQHSS